MRAARHGGGTQLLGAWLHTLSEGIILILTLSHQNTELAMVMERTNLVRIQEISLAGCATSFLLRRLWQLTRKAETSKLSLCRMQSMVVTTIFVSAQNRGPHSKQTRKRLDVWIRTSLDATLLKIVGRARFVNVGISAHLQKSVVATVTDVRAL